MFRIDLSEVVWLDEEILAERIDASKDKICVNMAIADLYASDSVRTMSDNWLKAWYTAETLASFTSEATYSVRDDDGTGMFEFLLIDVETTGMTHALIDLGPAFDPDDLEAMALIYDEAQEWLENKGNTRVRFPELQHNYEADTEAAEEWESQNPEDE